MTQDGTMVLSSELALTSIYPPTDFTGFKALKDAVTAKATSLRRGGHNQANRQELGSVVRLTYFPDIETLMVKVPSREHEIAHTNFGQLITRKVDRMNIPPAQFMALGSKLQVAGGRSLVVRELEWRKKLAEIYALSRLDLCAGLLPILQSSVPPTVKWCIDLSLSVPKDVWGVYLLVLQKPDQKTAIYVGSSTAVLPVYRGLRTRLQQHNVGKFVPPFVQKAKDDGSNGAVKVVLLIKIVAQRKMVRIFESSARFGGFAT
ncbi:hypothetical protein CNMCM5623_002577 [Aspergillus felis]|uniref:Uncharacterized protein n=1 Tax=Aspergillus felis TaxID=1287682 RepID=A0A8H6UM03_9EURO|nr:hypothetical protein CNMCM5623_002577 [Aspergillus felis]